MRADFQIMNHGSIFTFATLTERARDWWADNVGDAHAVEPRYVEAIVEGILEEGMTIQ